MKEGRETMKIVKTNAMRILEDYKISYEGMSYEDHDGKIDGISVAEKINEDPNRVFKTLVTKGKDNNFYVFVIPVAEELDLKKGAKVAGEKKIEMVPVNDLKKITGYIRGGCSPIGMKKKYPTFIDVRAENHEQIIVSGGKIGFQIKIKVEDLLAVTDGRLHDVVKNV